ncbi:MAG TPA: hypothetical protein PLT75_14760, partial [Spirochaetota bacterium]|nr:hypothetical protein [Spirochaetota bacterium]
MKKNIFFYFFCITAIFLFSCSQEDYFSLLTDAKNFESVLSASLVFRDIDRNEDRISGSLVIAAAPDETGLTSYSLYWGINDHERLSGTAPIAVFNAEGKNHTHTFPADTPVPAGATHFLVFTEGEEGEITVP